MQKGWRSSCQSKQRRHWQSGSHWGKDLSWLYLTPITPNSLSSRARTQTRCRGREERCFFYDEPQQVNQEVQSHEVLFVIEDFNAHAGNDSERHDKIMGTNGCGSINSNGRRLCDLCEENIIWPFEEVYCSTKRLARSLEHPQMARHTPR